MFRAVAVDLDGTLLNYNSQMTEKTLLTIKKLNNLNIPIIVCTGRSYYEAVYVLQGLDVCNYMVLLSGAELYDIRQNRILEIKSISIEDSTLIVNFLSGLDKCFYLINSNNKLYMLPSMKSIAFDVDMDFNDAAMSVELAYYEPSLISLVENGTILAEKYFISAKERSTINCIKNALSGKISAYFAEGAGNKIEIIPPSCSKADGLEKVLNILNIDSKDVIAFGDSENDIPMFQIVGTAVAMENSSDYVKSFADIIAPSNDENGVSAIIDSYIY